MTELRLWKLFHWQFVLIKIWYYQKQPNKDQPKSLSRCDEIMLRDEITGLDGMYLGKNHNFIYTVFVGAGFDWSELPNLSVGPN